MEAIARPADVPPETWGKFIQYHRARPEIWQAFEAKCLHAISKGRRVGAKCIAEAVRYDLTVERTGEYKFGNSYVSYYARIFAAKYPDQKLFEFRTVKGLRDD